MSTSEMKHPLDGFSNVLDTTDIKVLDLKELSNLNCRIR